MVCLTDLHPCLKTGIGMRGFDKENKNEYRSIIPCEITLPLLIPLAVLQLGLPDLGAGRPGAA